MSRGPPDTTRGPRALPGNPTQRGSGLAFQWRRYAAMVLVKPPKRKDRLRESGTKKKKEASARIQDPHTGAIAITSPTTAPYATWPIKCVSATDTPARRNSSSGCWSATTQHSARLTMRPWKTPKPTPAYNADGHADNSSPISKTVYNCPNTIADNVCKISPTENAVSRVRVNKLPTAITMSLRAQPDRDTSFITAVIATAPHRPASAAYIKKAAIVVAGFITFEG